MPNLLVPDLCSCVCCTLHCAALVLLNRGSAGWNRPGCNINDSRWVVTSMPTKMLMKLHNLSCCFPDSCCCRISRRHTHMRSRSHPHTFRSIVRGCHKVERLKRGCCVVPAVVVEGCRARTTAVPSRPGPWKPHKFNVSLCYCFTLWQPRCKSSGISRSFLCDCHERCFCVCVCAIFSVVPVEKSQIARL